MQPEIGRSHLWSGYARTFDSMDLPNLPMHPDDNAMVQMQPYYVNEMDNQQLKSDDMNPEMPENYRTIVGGPKSRHNTCRYGCNNYAGGYGHGSYGGYGNYGGYGHGNYGGYGNKHYHGGYGNYGGYGNHYGGYGGYGKYGGNKYGYSGYRSVSNDAYRTFLPPHHHNNQCGYNNNYGHDSYVGQSDPMSEPLPPGMMVSLFLIFSHKLMLNVILKFISS